MFNLENGMEFRAPDNYFSYGVNVLPPLRVRG